jgi:DNA (cytosine-5)-methyltransferase 1
MLETFSSVTVALRGGTEPSSQPRIAIPPTAFARPLTRNSGPRVLDLFAGAGGFSLGFELAGATVTAAIELDSWACETLEVNHPRTTVVQANIATLSDFDLQRIAQGSDIVVGGPPCQGFSVSNLRAGDPADPRNSLFKEFVRAVALIRPRAWIMENVPGLLRRRAACGRPVIQIIADEMQSLGYVVKYEVLEAQAYGVPQIRPRLFIIGLQHAPGMGTWFPSATHARDAPDYSLFASEQKLIPYVNLWEAIGDLPPVGAGEGTEVMPYDSAPKNDYQRLLRCGSEELFNHTAMRHSQRLVQRFSHVRCGESGLHAPRPHQARQRGNATVISDRGYSQNNRRMHPDRPCHTIPASFYANFIHPFQHRNFTPREGARIQSFPDWYRFAGKPTVVSTRLLSREGRTDELHLCQYNQIGNAVPPLVAFQLASHLISFLDW